MKRSAQTQAAGLDGDGSPRRTLPACVLPEGTVGDLISELKAQWKRYRKQLRRCQKKFSEEAIHDSRVETRRLLSYTELLAPFLSKRDVRRAERALKQHLDTFDNLRDTQVQLLAVVKLGRAFVAARHFEVYLRKREERFTRQTARNIKRVKTRRLEKMISKFAGQAARQATHHSTARASAMVLASAARAFHRAEDLRALIDPKDTQTIHCTRVAFKRFRYMVEALRPHLPGIDKQWLKAMHAYQTIMGDIQDAEVLVRSFDKFSSKKETEPGLAREFHEELVHRRESLIKRYLGVADQLLQFWPLPGTNAGPEIPTGAGRGPAAPDGDSPPSRFARKTNKRSPL